MICRSAGASTSLICRWQSSSADKPNADGVFRFKRLGFLGAGAMAEAITKAILNKKLVLPGNISMYDINDQRLDYLKGKYMVSTSSSVADTAEKSDLLIIACKPQNLEKLYSELKDCHLPSSTVLLSICAGVPLKVSKG